MIRLAIGLLVWSGQMETAQEKSPADIHVGHVATAMNGTPGGAGLVEAMEEEAKVAAQHAALAANDLTTLDSMKRHVKHVRHAIDPSTEEGGPGKGYGLSRAAAGVATHIKLAARSDGKTERIETHAPHISTSAGNVVSWCAAILVESDKVLAAETAEAAAESTERIAELTRHILDGTDADEDGQISWRSGEGGVAQVKTHLGLLLGR